MSGSIGAGVPGVPGVSHPGAGRLFDRLGGSRRGSSGVSRVSRRISKTIAHTPVRTHPHPHARSGFAFSPGHPGRPRGRGARMAGRTPLPSVALSHPGAGHPRTPQDTPPVGGKK